MMRTAIVQNTFNSIGYCSDKTHRTDFLTKIIVVNEFGVAEKCWRHAKMFLDFIRMLHHLAFELIGRNHTGE